MTRTNLMAPNIFLTIKFKATFTTSAAAAAADEQFLNLL